MLAPVFRNFLNRFCALGPLSQLHHGQLQHLLLHILSTTLPILPITIDHLKHLYTLIKTTSGSSAKYLHAVCLKGAAKRSLEENHQSLNNSHSFFEKNAFCSLVASIFSKNYSLKKEQKILRTRGKLKVYNFVL